MDVFATAVVLFIILWLLWRIYSEKTKYKDFDPTIKYTSWLHQKNYRKKGRYPSDAVDERYARAWRKKLLQNGVDGFTGINRISDNIRYILLIKCQQAKKRARLRTAYDVVFTRVDEDSERNIRNFMGNIMT